MFLFFGLIMGKMKVYPGDFSNSQNRLYLLSAAVQALAAILALGISAVLISVQLVSQVFTPKIIRLKVKDIYFWIFIGLYVTTILWILGLMAWMNRLKSNVPYDQWTMDVGILLVGASLLYLVPFVQITIKQLQPVVFIQKFLAMDEFQAVEETMHSAVDEGFSTIIDEAGKQIILHTLLRMAKESQTIRLETSYKTSSCFLNVGKRACRKKEDDCLFIILEHLKHSTMACTESIWRNEADVFNNALEELYDFILEWE
jgi:hypothetical protein